MYLGERGRSKRNGHTTSRGTERMGRPEGRKGRDEGIATRLSRSCVTKERDISPIRKDFDAISGRIFR